MTSTFTDSRDGKAYKTVKIGRLTWMAENLNYEAEGSKCYDNDPANGQKYGRLYDWETAMKACPPGWHLPSNKEWQYLADFAGGDRIAGEKLKATNGWDGSDNSTEDFEDYSSPEDYNGIDYKGPPNDYGCKDDYGFSALPGGCHSYDGFRNVGSNGNWWSSSGGSDDAYNWSMINIRPNVFCTNCNKGNLNSVRCVKD